MNLEEGEDIQSMEGSREGLNTADHASDVLPKEVAVNFVRRNHQRKTVLKDKLLEGPSR